MNKPRIVIINIGVSGAGKTTWAKKYIKSNPFFLRLNRDDIRRTLKGDLEDYYKQRNLNRIEELVNELELNMFISLIEEDYNIIIDNTNLKPTYVERWMSFINFWNDKFAEEKGKIDVIFKIFPENDVTLLKKRVDVRDSPIEPGALDYIDKQVQQLKGITHYIEDNYPDNLFTTVTKPIENVTDNNS